MARRAMIFVTALTMGVGALPLVSGTAQALQAPVAFTSAPLPTYQTNGIAWAVAQSQGLVFVGGTFTAIRPPGAAAGTSGTTRTNFAVFDAATGSPTSCAPTFTYSADPSKATVRSLNVSPDGQTLYVGGYFSAVNGVADHNLAAIDIASCTRVSSFKPEPNATVRAIQSTSTSVYFGGDLTSAGGQTRQRAAAASAVGTTTPGALLPWAPAFDKSIRALALRPDGGAVVVGGDFNTANGVGSHALAVVDPATGANVKTYPVGFIVAKSVVKDIAVDDTGFYTGNEGTGSGVFDGRIAVNWSNYAQRWRDTCLGATQAVVVYHGVLYSGSHAHDCSSMGEFPDGARNHFLAESVNDPTLLPWFPNTNEGIGEGVGPRDMVVATTPSGDYMWGVGEFTKVNGVAQQGLTRFGQGPDTVGPSLPAPSLTSRHAGEVRVAWRQSLDTDDALLTYAVYRDGNATPVYSGTGTSWFWSRRQMTFLDTGLAPGSTHTYKISATDGTNTVTTPSRSVVVAGVTTSPYQERILADGATFLWRYDEPSGVFVSDASNGNNNGTLKGSATYLAPGAIAGDPSHALTLKGATGSPSTGAASATIYSETRYPKPTAFTEETWFKTTTTTGGAIIGFGNKQTFQSNVYDKQVYMTNDGRLVFGVNSGGYVTITSPTSYNDGAWHYLAATQGPSGMALYVDGVEVGANSVTTSSGSAGYWRVGGDTLNRWPSAPSSAYFAGTLDETAVYPSALSASTIASHYAFAGAADSTTPSTPSNVSASVSGSSVTLSWDASTDNVGVTGYDVYRSADSAFSPSASTLVGSPSSTTFAEGSVPPGTWYYRVVAEDAAGNRSDGSTAVSAVVAASPTVVTVTPTADTYANEGAKSTNYGTSASLVSRGSPGAIAYLRFAPPAAPAGKTLTSAVLRVRTTTDSFAGSTESHTVQLSGDDWTEASLTWNNRPALTGNPIGTLAAGTSPNTVYDVTLDASALQGLTGGEATLAMTNTGTDSLWFWSRNHANASYRPQLILTYS